MGPAQPVGKKMQGREGKSPALEYSCQWGWFCKSQPSRHTLPGRGQGDELGVGGALRSPCRTLRGWGLRMAKLLIL